MADNWVEPQPPYPKLTLSSTLSDLLELGCDRSSDLTDGGAKVLFVTPWQIRISWPRATGDMAVSVLSINLLGRPMGGARIGPWQSEPKPSVQQL